MKRISSRTIICLCIAGILLLGSLIFVWRFFSQGRSWAAFPSNDHLFEDGVMKYGVLYDREGELLAGADGGEWDYSNDSDIRKATLHSVGVPYGTIATGAITRFASRLSGYNFITGADAVWGNGRDLYLTLDADACKTAYRALNGKKGTVGVYNYKTGEIRCLVSVPTYDPARILDMDEEDPDNEGVYINRLLSASFVPGSTFKLVTAAAALETLDDVESRAFHCDGHVSLDGAELTCTKAHGDLTFEEALNVSCNCVFGSLAVEMGSDVMAEYTKKTGLETSYSVNGIDTAVSTFDFDVEEGELAWAGSGQGKNLVNPCSLMVYAGAIAGGGEAAEPQIISKCTFPDGNLRTGFYIRHYTQVDLKTKTAMRLKGLMRSNVENNYGVDSFPGLQICAKSGTAEVGGKKADTAWFTGFLDDDAHPYAFVVMVEEGGSGAQTAGRVANKVLQEIVDEDDLEAGEERETK